MTNREERRGETSHRLGFMTPLLIFVLAFVACCGVIACVFLRAAGISDEAARKSAGVSLCRSAAEEFRAGNIPESGEKRFFSENLADCEEADVCYYTETEVNAEESKTGTVYIGKITAYAADREEIYTLTVHCYRSKEETP